ncbi:flavorubredoxin [Rhodobium orientis]|uniref:MBL fold metallo-hydrolase n=1 Tax=Rhodobium orientis TaxID=34017 RepID=A0A327JHK4_9HYPH|nr:FprA family A-type flavoprotein [Rhodobium orientis]MBB4304374.1 flavorubredoxin [Rhodobium orientis]MBK5951980.1 MBL fold metallo-hydrolase [Rhodobium orientis]RAI25759.1 MBL fold metallo-hydrolase [Rhodobium orientis]
MLAKLPEPVEIAGGVHWIGALDPDLRTFDLILKTANGTTYNAYAVRGPEGVVVVDTVKEEFSEEFFTRLEQVADYDEIRAVILNHLEPDHTGAVPELMRRAPHAHIFCSVRALKVLTALLKDELDNYGYTLTDTGDRCSLSGRPISFVNTPYLHWPDTQCTFLEDEKLLFSGDVFGCHFCDDRLYNDRVGDFRFSFEYYFKHIMRPFKRWVLQAVDKIEPLAPELIAPAHGPILRDNPLSYVRSYRTLSNSYLPNEVEGREKSLLVFYMSAYGATADMAKAVHDGASSVEGVRVSLYDLQGGETEPFVDLIESADGLVFGSPTVNGDAVKPVWDVLASLISIETRGKLGGAFGSYGWSGEAVPMIEDRLRGLKMRVPAKGLRIKFHPTDKELDDCRDYGRTLAESLVGKAKPKVVDFADL